MKHSIDPKPFGAFIEYTLKPLIDDSRELIDILEAKGLDFKSCLNTALKLYIFDKVLTLLTSVIVTGMICSTVYFILSNYHPTIP